MSRRASIIVSIIGEFYISFEFNLISFQFASIINLFHAAFRSILFCRIVRLCNFCYNNVFIIFQLRYFKRGSCFLRLHVFFFFLKMLFGLS